MVERGGGSMELPALWEPLISKTSGAHRTSQQDASGKQRLLRTTAVQSREHNPLLWELRESTDARKRTFIPSQCYQNLGGPRPLWTPREDLHPTPGSHLNNWIKQLTWDSVKKDRKGTRKGWPLTTIIEYSVGSPTHSDQTRRNKRRPNWKEGSKTVIICRWQNTI